MKTSILKSISAVLILAFVFAVAIPVNVFALEKPKVEDADKTEDGNKPKGQLNAIEESLKALSLKQREIYDTIVQKVMKMVVKTDIENKNMIVAAGFFVDNDGNRIEDLKNIDSYKGEERVKSILKLLSQGIASQYQNLNLGLLSEEINKKEYAKTQIGYWGTYKGRQNVYLNTSKIETIVYFALNKGMSEQEIATALVDMVKHEKAHIENKSLTEEQVREIAPVPAIAEQALKGEVKDMRVDEKVLDALVKTTKSRTAVKQAFTEVGELSTNQHNALTSIERQPAGVPYVVVPYAMLKAAALAGELEEILSKVGTKEIRVTNVPTEDMGVVERVEFKDSLGIPFNVTVKAYIEDINDTIGLKTILEEIKAEKTVVLTALKSKEAESLVVKLNALRLPENVSIMAIGLNQDLKFATTPDYYMSLSRALEVFFSEKVLAANKAFVVEDDAKNPIIFLFEDLKQYNKGALAQKVNDYLTDIQNALSA